MSHIPRNSSSQKPIIPKPTPTAAPHNYDPLNSVRLPPPSSASDGAYDWVHGQSVICPGNPGDVNMLRTPNSIFRPGENHPMKRASVPSIEPNKRPRHITPESNPPRQREEGCSSRAASNRTIAMPETQADNSRQWSAYFSRAFPGFEFGNDRPNSANLPMNNNSSLQFLPPNSQFNNFSTGSQQTQMMHASSMLSPNSPHLNTVGYAQTPTRSERPHSVSSGLDFYDTTAASFIIPPPPSVLHSNVSTRHQMSEKYPYTARSNGSEFQHIEVPPPDQMPPLEDDGTKPNYSYAMLIGMAISRAPERKLTSSQIYKWIMDTFAYYRKSKPAWHNSIRHNLSSNKAFEKRVRPKDDPGKGSYWTIVEGLEYQFFKPTKPKKIDLLGNPEQDGATAVQSNVVKGTQGFREHVTSTHSFNNDGMNTANVSLPTNRGQAVTGRIISSTSDNVIDSIQQKAEPIVQLEQAVSYYSSHQDGIPSDGTEPDDCLMDEREKADKNRFSSSSTSSDPYAENDVSNISGKEMDSAGELPQMRAMSTGSSRHLGNLPKTHLDSGIMPRPSSPSINKEKRFSNGAASISSNRTVRNDSNNEWRGQGQFAFRCSTPSMLRNNVSGSTSCVPNDTNSNPSSVASVAQTNRTDNNQPQIRVTPVPSIPSSNPEVSNTDMNQQSLDYECDHESDNSSLRRICTDRGVINNTDLQNSLTAKRAVHLPSIQSSGLHKANRVSSPSADKLSSSQHKTSSRNTDAFIFEQLPKTPEKGCQNAPTVVPSTSRQKLQYSRPSMLQRQSLESPYAGTLDSSPGLSFTDRQSSGNHVSQKQSSFTNLTDLSDLDFYSKELTSNKHSRNISDSSDENINGAVIPSNHNILGPSSLINNFAIPFDLESSPKMVVTPVRRPFDTPIRDQSHAYSPYYRASNGKGSPVRRL